MSDSRKGKTRRPKLHPKMSLSDFRDYYWMKAELAEFARQLGLPTHGYKPELSARIERRLRNLPDEPETRRAQPKMARDSAMPLRRDTPVVNYKNDDKTRAFFESQIGPDFHFTYHLNQYRLAHEGLTYGDLVDEWVAERERRQRDDYVPPIAEHGKYNRFIRDFFNDERNKGKSMRDAATAWNAIKKGRGDHSYSPRDKRKRKG